jgi:hypothetical protein
MSFWPFDWNYGSGDEESSWLTSTLIALLIGSSVAVYRWKIRPPIICPSGVKRSKQAIPIKVKIHKKEK